MINGMTNGMINSMISCMTNGMTNGMTYGMANVFIRKEPRLLSYISVPIDGSFN